MPTQMHLQQTKKGSRRSGGAQYYFHYLTDSIKLYLRKKGAVPVALVTPYGATKSDFLAVGEKHKREGSAVVPGKVGHDRVHKGGASESIGEAIRRWYQLPTGDLDRIVVDVVSREDVFYLTPLSVKYTGRARSHEITRFRFPLSFTTEFQSPLWKQQIAKIRSIDADSVAWAFDEICRVVADHSTNSKTASVHEIDILRAGGALSRLGMRLGPYLTKGYDCDTEFEFLNFPPYRVPVEIKRDSTGFKYQQGRYGKEELSRAVILCAVHGHKTLPDHIDVIELEALCQLAT